MAERWIIDTGRPLVLPLSARQGVVRVIEQATPDPPLRTQFAQRPEGSLPTSRERENRTITLKLELAPPTDQWARVTHDFGTSPVEAQGDGDVPGWRGTVRRVDARGSAIGPAISDLAAAVGALASEKNGTITGTLIRVLESGERITFDVLQCETDAPTWDLSYFVAGVTSLALTFTCLPFGRGTERLLGSRTLSPGQRWLSFDDLVVPGDVPALARLRFSGASVGQSSVLFASDQPDPGSRAVGLQLAASSLDYPAGAAIRSYGEAVSNSYLEQTSVTQDVPANVWQPLLMLRRSGAPLDLRGTYRVFWRGFSVADTNLRLRWSAGAREGGMTVNRSAVLSGDPSNVRMRLVDLGTVAVGEGAVLDGVVERSLPTAGSTCSDVLLFVPAANSAVATASTAPPAQEIIHADYLQGTGAALTNSADSVSGTWSSVAGSGGAEFLRSPTGTKRTAGTGTWRAATLPITSAATEVRASTVLPVNEFAFPSRYVPHAAVVLGNTAGITAVATGTGVTGAWAVAAGYQRVAGEVEPVAWIVSGTRVKTVLPLNYNTIKLGTEMVYMGLRCSGSTAVHVEFASQLWFYQNDLVAAAPPTSALMLGIISHGLNLAGGTPATVEIRGMVAMAPSAGWVADQALFPAQVSEVATAGTTRTSPTGLSGPISGYEGERPMLPPSGREGRTTRVVLGTTRSPLSGQVDPSTGDPFTGEVYATPRYLQIPDGS